jgi:hypothetical protein
MEIDGRESIQPIVFIKAEEASVNDCSVGAHSLQFNVFVDDGAFIIDAGSYYN